MPNIKKPTDKTMPQIFIELYSYKDTWSSLAQSARTDFVEKVKQEIEGLKPLGVELIAFGFNHTNTDRRAPYDFFCVYKVPSAEFCREFEKQIAASNWYEYFEQIVVSGSLIPVNELMGAHARLDKPGLPAGSHRSLFRCAQSGNRGCGCAVSKRDTSTPGCSR
jgi:Family of unknown function (DUF6616)